MKELSGSGLTLTIFQYMPSCEWQCDVVDESGAVLGSGKGARERDAVNDALEEAERVFLEKTSNLFRKFRVASESRIAYNDQSGVSRNGNGRVSLQ